MEQFMRDWWTANNKVLQGADPEILKEYFEPACEACQKNYATARAFHLKGHKADSPPYDFVSATVAASNRQLVSVQAVVKPNPSRLVDRRGRTVREVVGGPPIDYVVSLARDGGRWRIYHQVSLGARPR
ncbi:MAG: hypothetical protein M3P91_01415 [Actinomycetota bacterium]|nr:hypothetical protein [Actinomycetota bacterium]